MSQRLGRFSDPRDPKRLERITLAYGEWKEIPKKLIDKYGEQITELDLSFNNFFDLKSLHGFTKLTTIIGDHNNLSERSTFPPLNSLKILWVNHNQITNLSLFIETISKSYPNVTFLSMINNEAAPSYFNGGTYNSYRDYRLFVISSLSKLQILDGITISDKERKEAVKVYGKRQVKTHIKKHKI